MVQKIHLYTKAASKWSEDEAHCVYSTVTECAQESESGGSCGECYDDLWIVAGPLAFIIKKEKREKGEGLKGQEELKGCLKWRDTCSELMRQRSTAGFGFIVGLSSGQKQLQTQQRLNLTLCGLNCESFAWQEEEYESSAGATTLTFALCCWLTYGIVSFYFNIWGEREQTLCKSTRYFIQLQILIRGRRQGTHRLSLHHITMMSHRQVIVRCEKLR